VTKSDYLCHSRVCCRVRVTRRVEFTRQVRVWNYFPTRVHSRVTRRVKFSPNGYGWALPIGYVPVAIVTPDASVPSPSKQTSGPPSPPTSSARPPQLHLAVPRRIMRPVRWDRTLPTRRDPCMCLPSLDVAQGFSCLRRATEHHAVGHLLYRSSLSGQDFFAHSSTIAAARPLLSPSVGWRSISARLRGTDFLLVLVSNACLSR
jgi:hypothetical protein